MKVDFNNPPDNHDHVDGFIFLIFDIPIGDCYSH